MALVPSASIVSPISVTAMPAFGQRARGAFFLLTLDADHKLIDLDLSHLPPPQTFDYIGAVFVDARQAAGEVFVYFPDTQALTEVAPGTQAWVLAITGTKRFQISVPYLTGADLIQIGIQVVNFAVQPNAANLLNVSGSVTVTNSGPEPVAASDITIFPGPIPVAINTVIAAADPTRQFLRIQAPPSSDMWVNWTGGPASVGGSGCFLMFAGEKYSTAGNAETIGQVSVFLVNAPGVVPVIQG